VRRHHQLAAFWVAFLMMVSCHPNIGGLLQTSVTNAVQASFFEVARILAEELLFKVLPITELTLNAVAGDVPRITLPPGLTLSDVAAASFTGGPPGPANSSTPTCMAAASVEVQEKNEC